MSTINHQKLRELAFALQRMATPQKLLTFRAMLSPSAVLALLDELEHARTTAPAIRLTLHHEIADFCATLEAPGEPETPEAIQQELLQRIDKVFDFFSEPVRDHSMNKKTWFRAYMWALVCVIVSLILYAGLLPRMISSDSSFLVLLGIFIAMLYPAGVVRLFSKYIKEIKQ